MSKILSLDKNTLLTYLPVVVEKESRNGYNTIRLMKARCEYG